ncbi:hypothetical protein NC652_028191 [Populus alba x Populus x berolinensis]|nr:hypothetical protein NC652_028191 [Populus alba x Populus x berolinensis]
MLVSNMEAAPASKTCSSMKNVILIYIMLPTIFLVPIEV